MIDDATARRLAGDWAGACAAARVDVDLDLRSVARHHGDDVAAALRTDLRHLVPDLLRWHLPRIAPDGLLRPGLTILLTRYPGSDAQLVVRTAPGWADAGQRISLAVWDGSGAAHHPHPRPDRRFRLDLHRHLWDDRRTGELAHRSGVDGLVVPDDLPSGCAVHRWAAEAAILLAADADAVQPRPGSGSRGSSAGGAVVVRLGRRRFLLTPADPTRRHAGVAGPAAAEVDITPWTGGRTGALPVLPDAATWVLPDLALVRAGLIMPDQLHPLVAAELAPHRTATPPPPGPHRVAGRGDPRIVDCRGARHRLGLVDGVLVPLDHHPDELRREGLLVALTGTPLPCLRAVDEAHRRPGDLADVRARLDHGDFAGALATVERLLGPDVLLRAGALRDELETAAGRRVQHGLYRAGLAGHPGRGLGAQPVERPRRRWRGRLRSTTR